MKIVVSQEFAEQMGVETDKAFTPWHELEDKWFGDPGTPKRRKHDREMVKLLIKETFVTFLLYPLRFFPWGHVAERFWFYYLTSGSFYNALDGLSFCYFGDKYVVGLRDAIYGKRHNYHKYMTVPDTKGPYDLSSLKRYPIWLLTRLIWPQFKEIVK